MTDKAPRTHLVHARLNNAEYAAFRQYVESNPDFENNESVALRGLIRKLPAVRPPAAPVPDVKRKEKRQ